MLFILNQDLQIVDVLSMKGVISKGNSIYFEDYYTQMLGTGAETFEFKTIANSKESEKLVVGNYIAFREDGEDKLFNIIETTESKSEDGFIKHVYCEMHGIELKNCVVRPMQILNASPEKFATQILEGTDWELGKVDDIGTLLDIKIEEHTSVYDAIQKHLVEGYGMEIYYTVDIQRNSVVNKYLNIVESRGFDNGLRFTYDKNIQNIERTIDVSQLCTALIGVGNNEITFKSVEATDKPLNQDFIEDLDAYRQWSVNGYHIFGYEKFDTDSPQELLKLTREKLKERCNPKVKYSLNAELLDDVVGIGDYVRITDMDFEPAITLSARISTLVRSKTDVEGNSCEISNFKELQSNITQQMRNLASNLKGYVDGINIDNINKGGFLTSKIETVDDDTLRINNQIERGRDFCMEVKHLTPAPVITDFEVPNGTVMQNSMIDYHENKIYVAYDETGNGKLVLLQMDMNGKILGRMNLNDFGHGNSMGIERRGSKTYIWTECDGKKSSNSNPNKLRGSKICYFEFKDGITANKTYGKVIDILPNWVSLSLAVDAEYNQLVVRGYDKIGGTAYYHIYDLKSVISGSPKLLKKFKDLALVGSSVLQGFDILGRFLYIIQGAGYYTHPADMDTYIQCIDLDTMKIRYTHLIDILPDMPYREIEGIKVVKRSENNYELQFGMASEHQKPRKNHIFKYVETLTNEEDALGKFVHPNGTTTLIREGLIKVDSSKRRNYLMHVVDGERFGFEDGYSDQIIVANYENGTWYCDKKPFNPMANDCIIGNVDKNGDNGFKLTIYAENDKSVGHTISGSSDAITYENGKIVVNAGGLVGVLPSNLLEVEGISTQHLKANSISADKIQANSISADKIQANSISADKIQANSISADKIQANSIETNHLKSEVFETVDAKIQNAVIDKATITELTAINGEIQNLKSEKADITELNAVKGNIQYLESNIGKIGSLESDIANIEHILAGNITADNIQAGAITAGSGIIADGAIGSAQISTIDAGKISAGKIDTSKVEVAGADNHLRIKGNRLQVFQGTGNQAKERVSLGDVNGDGSIYGFRVRGADGKTVLLDENGVKSEGITDGSITNDKISDNAEIDGAKLNINSVVSKLNEDGTEVIKGTKIEVDGTTLTTKLSTITDKQTEQGEKITENSTLIKANEDAIKLKVDTQTYQTDQKGTKTTLEKHTSEIDALKGEIALKVGKTEVESMIDEVSGEVIDSKIETAKGEIKVITDEISQRVSSTEQTTSNLSENYSNLSSRVSNAESKLTQNGLTTIIGNHYTTSSDVNGIVDKKGYATTSQVTQTTNELQAKFSESGGYNLLRNGCAKNGTAYWYSNGGGISTGSEGDGGNLGKGGTYFHSAFPSGITGDWVVLKPNTDYVYSAKLWTETAFNGSSSTPLHYWCSTTQTSGSSQLTVIDYNTNCKANTWNDIYIHFRTKSGTVYFKPFIYCGGTDNITFSVSELMLCEGSLKLPYSPHPSEIYDGITTIDKDGITVTANNVRSKTSMSADGFKITKTDNNEDIFKVNSDGTLYMKGQINVTGGTVPNNVLDGTLVSNASAGASAKSVIDQKASGWDSTKTTVDNNSNKWNNTSSTVDDKYWDWSNAYDRVKEWANESPTGWTTINGGMIATNTITANKIAVGDFNNYSQLRKGHSLSNAHGTATWSSNNAEWSTSSNYFPVTIDNTDNAFNTGDEINFKATVWIGESKNMNFGVWFYDANKNHVCNNTTTQWLEYGWNTVNVPIKLSNTNINKCPYMQIMINNGGTYIGVKDVVVNRKITGELIVDGAINGKRIEGVDIIGSTFMSKSESFKVTDDGRAEAITMSVDDEISTDTLSVNYISNSKYQAVLDRSYNVHVNPWYTEEEEAQTLVHGGRYRSFDNLINVCPRNLNGYNLTINLWSDIDESVNFNMFNSGTVTINLNGCKFRGYMICQGHSMKYRIYGKDSDNTGTGTYGSIMPHTGHSATGGNYSIQVSYSHLVAHDLKIYGGKTSGNNSGMSVTNLSKAYLNNLQFVSCYSAVRSYSASDVYIASSNGLTSSHAFYASSGSRINLNGTNQAGRSGSTSHTGTSGNAQVYASGVSFDGSSVAGSNDTSAPTKVTKTVTITSNYGDTYRKTVYDNWKKDGTVRQGEWSSYGDCMGAWFFGTKLSDYSNKEITKVELTIKRQSGGNHGDVTHTLKMHDYTSRPNGQPSYRSDFSKNFSVAVNNSAKVTLTSSSDITAFKKCKGFGLVPTSYNSTYYSVCSGTLTVKITYKE